MKYYFYNRIATSGKKPVLANGEKAIDAIGFDFKKFFDGLMSEDEVVLIGGDTSVNQFIRKTKGVNIRNNVYLKANGTGDDFLTDIGGSIEEEVLINPYLKKLPIARIKNVDRPFVNGVGSGLDGYCCEVADEQKASHPSAEINYTSIAIKGLLLKFKPFHAVVTVDGKKHEYDNVWIVSTMKGRYYGGGMKIAPDQDRDSDHLSVVVYRASSKFKALTQFTSIFKGTHVNNKEMVEVLTGKNIHIKLSKPIPVQIDGVAISNVEEYRVEY